MAFSLSLAERGHSTRATPHPEVTGATPHPAVLNVLIWLCTDIKNVSISLDANWACSLVLTMSGPQLRSCT